MILGKQRVCAKCKGPRGLFALGSWKETKVHRALMATVMPGSTSSPSHVPLLLKFDVYVSASPNRKMLILKPYWIDILMVTNISVISVYQRNNHSSSDIARESP